MLLTFAATLLDGFGEVLTPQNLLLAAVGVTLGTLVGVLPGIGPALTIALLLPLTFNFSDPVGAFILFAGIYAGGMYGGATTSILLNTPGGAASVATAIEGFPMAKRRGGRPLAAWGGGPRGGGRWGPGGGRQWPGGSRGGGGTLPRPGACPGSGCA